VILEASYPGLRDETTNRLASDPLRPVLRSGVDSLDLRPLTRQQFKKKEDGDGPVLDRSRDRRVNGVHSPDY
jgi:hypothetical protein